MQITNSSTGDTITIRADHIVAGTEGNLLVEAMFSGIVDLSSPSANVAARLHPNKARTFEWDDREVFVVQQPQSDTVEKIRQFLGNYWQETKSPWWKFW